MMAGIGDAVQCTALPAAELCVATLCVSKVGVWLAIHNGRLLQTLPHTPAAFSSSALMVLTKR